ncbi:hypothetical protein ACTXT7_016690, partial [Hymenolepis weldensis]
MAYKQTKKAKSSYFISNHVYYWTQAKIFYYRQLMPSSSYAPPPNTNDMFQAAERSAPFQPQIMKSQKVLINLRDYQCAQPNTSLRRYTGDKRNFLLLNNGYSLTPRLSNETLSNLSKPHPDDANDHQHQRHR